MYEAKLSEDEYDEKEYLYIRGCDFEPDYDEPDYDGWSSYPNHMFPLQFKLHKTEEQVLMEKFRIKVQELIKCDSVDLIKELLVELEI